MKSNQSYASFVGDEFSYCVIENDSKLASISQTKPLQSLVPFYNLFTVAPNATRYASYIQLTTAHLEIGN